MSETKKTLNDKVEDTMACIAFAEAGEPCPITNIDKEPTSSEAAEGQGKSTLESIENTMACSAFAEAGEPCPIETDRTNK
ncbi:MAG: hypothetical protein KJ990_07425 [Proteobacteria bacterium]|nr:hypothetical protein [Pseudomonadota bacterium]MBU1649004.1 hypothetical protein [Pseudomonadota bacterium]